MPTQLHRYQQLIASMIPAISASPVVIDPKSIPIDCGVTGPIVELPTGSPPSIIDAAGHNRPIYRSLLICNWLRLPEPKRQTETLLAWIDTLDNTPGDWLARAIAAEVLGETRWRKPAAAVFHQLATQQLPGGALLPVDNHANPETRWYEELMMLHALSIYTAIHPSPGLELAVKNAALFHLEETQPDHASAQPWGLLAFVQYAPPLADQVLHAMGMQYPGGVSGVPLLLLNDALYGLQLLNGQPHDEQ